MIVMHNRNSLFFLALSFFYFTSEVKATAFEPLILRGKTTFLIIFPDTLKTLVNPESAVKQSAPLFEYFLNNTGKLYDGESRRNCALYDFPNIEYAKMYGHNFININSVFDSVISSIDQFRFLEIEIDSNMIKGINYLLFEIDMEYYTLDVGKKFCDPLTNSLGQPSGFLPHRILKIPKVDIPLSKGLKKMLFEEFPTIKEFVRGWMHCYSGID